MKSQKRPDVQYLRGVSILLVILFHAEVPHFNYGYLGVDIFFVISGYFVSSKLYERFHSSGRIGLGDFYRRRFIRIAPTLMIMLVFGLLLSHLFLFPKDYLQSIAVAGASMLGLGNSVLMNQSSGYFSESLKNHPFLHLWSLSIEFQYYLFFPVFYYFVRKRVRLRCALITGIFLLGILVILQKAVFNTDAGRFFLLPFRLYELFAGALAWELRCLWFHNKDFSEARKFILVLSVSLLFLAFVYTINLEKSAWLYSLHQPTLAILVGAILCFGGTGDRAGFPFRRPIMYLGAISYALYLFHQPIFSIQREIFSEHTNLLYIASIALALVLAHFSTFQVERSAIQSKSKWLLPVMLYAYLMLFVAIAMLFYFAKKADGYPNRLSGAIQGIASTAVDSPLGRKCHTDGPNYRNPNDACIYFGGIPKWVVLGDSHGITPAYALAKTVTGRNEAVVHLTFSGCSVPWGTPNSHCEKWTNQALNFIIESTTIENVLIAYRIHAGLMGRHESVYPALPDNGNSEASRQEIIQRYVSLSSKLKQAGKRVILLGQAPEVGGNFKQLRRVSGNENVVSVSRLWWDRRTSYFRSNLNQILALGVEYVDPADVLCSSLSCWAIQDGLANYYDRDHLSIYGAQKVINLLKIERIN